MAAAKHRIIAQLKNNERLEFKYDVEVPTSWEGVRLIREGGETLAIPHDQVVYFRLEEWGEEREQREREREERRWAAQERVEMMLVRAQADRDNDAWDASKRDATRRMQDATQHRTYQKADGRIMTQAEVKAEMLKPDAVLMYEQDKADLSGPTRLAFYAALALVALAAWWVW